MSKQEIVEKIKRAKIINNFKEKIISDETSIVFYNKILNLKKKLKQALIEENPKASNVEIEKILNDLINIDN